MRRDCPNTALNYYQNLLRRRIVSDGRETTQRLPEHCPSAFYNKNSELTSPLIEVQILPIIFCPYYPETEKGQNRSPVLNLIQPNIEFVANPFCNRIRHQCRIYPLRSHHSVRHYGGCFFVRLGVKSTMRCLFRLCVVVVKV